MAALNTHTFLQNNVPLKVPKEFLKANFDDKVEAYGLRRNSSTILDAMLQACGLGQESKHRMKTIRAEVNVFYSDFDNKKYDSIKQKLRRTNPHGLSSKKNSSELTLSQVKENLKKSVESEFKIVLYGHFLDASIVVFNGDIGSTFSRVTYLSDNPYDGVIFLSFGTISEPTRVFYLNARKEKTGFVQASKYLIRDADQEEFDYPFAPQTPPSRHQSPHSSPDVSNTPENPLKRKHEGDDQDYQDEEFALMNEVLMTPAKEDGEHDQDNDDQDNQGGEDDHADVIATFDVMPDGVPEYKVFPGFGHPQLDEVVEKLNSTRVEYRRRDDLPLHKRAAIAVVDHQLFEFSERSKQEIYDKLQTKVVRFDHLKSFNKTEEESLLNNLRRAISTPGSKFPSIIDGVTSEEYLNRKDEQFRKNADDQEEFVRYVWSLNGFAEELLHLCKGIITLEDEMLVALPPPVVAAAASAAAIEYNLDEMFDLPLGTESIVLSPRQFQPLDPVRFSAKTIEEYASKITLMNSVFFQVIGLKTSDKVINKSMWECMRAEFSESEAIRAATYTTWLETLEKRETIIAEQSQMSDAINGFKTQLQDKFTQANAVFYPAWVSHKPKFDIAHYEAWAGNPSQQRIDELDEQVQRFNGDLDTILMDIAGIPGKSESYAYWNA